MPRPLLDVVIVTASGNREFVRACLVSIEKNRLTHGEMRIFVVDNASLDGTPEMIESEFPHVILERLAYNAGFAIGNNFALRRTTARFVLLLNPDTEVLPGTLDYMLEVMENRPDVGMAGCRLVRRDGSFDHAAKRSFPTPVGALAHFTGLSSREDVSPHLAQYRAPEIDEYGTGEVDAVNGAFMLVRREALEEVGLFDEGYWLYMEDLDWCYRFKQRGWKIWYDGRVSVVHVKGGASLSRGHRRLRQNLAFHRGMVRFYKKFYAGRRPLVDAAVYAGIGVKFAYSAGKAALAQTHQRLAAETPRDGSAEVRSRDGSPPRGTSAKRRGQRDVAERVVREAAAREGAGGAPAA
jgi:N-acetylglucosaminyl-diphospho-decaprenol L-rhamnosyltransferase